MHVEGPSRPTSATTALPACPAMRPPAVGGARRPPLAPRPTDRSAGFAGRGRVYDRPVSLSVLAGPANAGKVALLLERYLEALEHDPVLIVPYRSDVDRVERDLLTKCGALVGGSIGTFDHVFERIARDGGSRLPIATEA